MMAEPKPLASLSGSLLARKGAAKPAMRRQGDGGLSSIASHNLNDDLGWNDMGYDVDPAQSNDAVDHQRVDLTPMLTPVPLPRKGDERAADQEQYAVPEVVRQREALARSFDTESQNIENVNSDNMEAETAPSESIIPETESGFGDKMNADLSAPVRSVLQTKPAKRAAAIAPPVETKPRVQTAPKAKAAFTLRIDPERHLRLRLASALTRRSAQVILTDALDKYLKTLPEVDAFALQLPNS